MPELTFYSRLPYVYNTFGEVCRNTHFSAATLRPSLELFLPKFIVKNTPDGGAPWRKMAELTFYSSHVVANHSILLGGESSPVVLLQKRVSGKVLAVLKGNVVSFV